MAYSLEVAVNSNTNYIYVTDADINENLWARLPIYFDNFMNDDAFNCPGENNERK